MEKCSFKERIYESKQYELCLQWFEFIINDLFSDGKHSGHERNIVLSQFMSTMERAFEIPLLPENFETWSLDHPEVSELFCKASDARDLSIYSDECKVIEQLYSRLGDLKQVLSLVRQGSSLHHKGGTQK